MKRYALILTVSLTLAVSARAEFRAGIASIDVTPNQPMPVSGGLGTPGPTHEIKGLLEVRALVLEDDDTRIAIVTSPSIGFPSVLGNRVRSMVESISPENVLIGATHTHSAPDMYAFLDERGNCTADLDYIDRVCRDMATVIELAVENLRPASLKVATGEAQGKIAYNYYAPQLYDPRVDVLQAIGDDGEPFATLVNYAIHPEVIGPNRGILSPDMVGPLHDRIEELGGGMGIFMNGAQGGMVTADERGRDERGLTVWEECIRIGNLLAEESLRIVGKAPLQEDPDLWCGATDLTLPMDNPMFRAIIKSSPLDYVLNPDNTVTTQLNVVNVGSAQMLTIPGEALPNIGYYLKRNMYGTSNFLLGLTNDAFGYMMVREDFNSFDRYEYISRTSLGEHAGDLYIDKALAFVDASPRPTK